MQWERPEKSPSQRTLRHPGGGGGGGGGEVEQLSATTNGKFARPSRLANESGVHRLTFSASTVRGCTSPPLYGSPGRRTCASQGTGIPVQSWQVETLP